MKNFLAKIGKFLKKRGPLLGLLLACGFVLSALDIDLAHAADPDVKETTEQSLGFLLSLLMQGLNIFLWPFLVILGELMDNDMIIGPGMEERLLSIWVQIRNLVNIAFAVFLLIIAFYNVLPLTEGEGNLAMKTALPKLVLGLILVNFTFLGGKIILDVSNVATTAAFALPELVDDFDFDDERESFREEVCMKQTKKASDDDPDVTETTFGLWDPETDKNKIPIYTLLFCELAEAEGKSTYPDSEGTDTTYEYKAGGYTGALNSSMETTYFEDLNANNVGLVMAINMGALDSLSLLKDDAIQDFGDLVINGLFSLVMYFIMACTYLVLGLVLLARIVVLWVALALSPLVVLFYVIPQIKEAVGSNLDIVEKVTKHLLAPVIIGLTLTIGYMMLSAMGDLTQIASFNYKADDLMSTQFLMSGAEDMEKFIIAITSVVIVWSGVFAAAEGTVAATATGAIQGFGERIGKTIAKAPLYATTVPVATGEKGESISVSPMAFLNMADAAANSIGSPESMQRQMQKLRDISPVLDRLAPATDMSRLRSKEQNQQKAVELATQGTITREQAQDMARSLAATADAAGNKDLATELRTIGAEIAEDGNLEKLRSVVNREGHERLGLKEDQYGQIKTGVAAHHGRGVIPEEASAPPTDPAASADPAEEQPWSSARLNNQYDQQVTRLGADHVDVTAAKEAIDAFEAATEPKDKAAKQALAITAMEKAIAAEEATP